MRWAANALNSECTDSERMDATCALGLTANALDSAHVPHAVLRAACTGVDSERAGQRTRAARRAACCVHWGWQ
eukprot:241641-Alexandrium_andersonii.AAC.1